MKLDDAAMGSDDRLGLRVVLVAQASLVLLEPGLDEAVEPDHARAVLLLVHAAEAPRLPGHILRAAWHGRCVISSAAWGDQDYIAVGELVVEYANAETWLWIAANEARVDRELLSFNDRKKVASALRRRAEARGL